MRPYLAELLNRFRQLELRKIAAKARKRLARELAICDTVDVFETEVLEALADAERLQILGWLRDPEAHFPRRRFGDLVGDGVCSCRIAEKLAVSQPACAGHLRVLNRAGLVRGRKIKRCVFYQRDETRIAAVRNQLSGDW
jgi:DNA-binding transcriptional ArsR family regulator